MSPIAPGLWGRKMDEVLDDAAMSFSLGEERAVFKTLGGKITSDRYAAAAEHRALAINSVAKAPSAQKKSEKTIHRLLGFILGPHMSRYCVSSIISSTVCEVTPPTSEVKLTTESLRPAMMACRCRAIPWPCRYLDSASASAALGIGGKGSEERVRDTLVIHRKKDDIKWFTNHGDDSWGRACCTCLHQLDTVPIRNASLSTTSCLNSSLSHTHRSRPRSQRLSAVLT